MNRKDLNRLIFGIPTLLFCFALILLDASGEVDISKFGYAGIGSWITIILQFYFRKAGKDNKPK